MNSIEEEVRSEIDGDTITIELFDHQYDFVNNVMGDLDGINDKNIENKGYRESLLATGLGGGKTYVAGYLATLITDMYPGCPGAIIAPTYTQLRDSTLNGMSVIWDELSVKYNIVISGVRKGIHLNGAEVFLRTLKYPETIKGLPDIGWICIDEASLGNYRQGFRYAVGRLRKSKKRVNGREHMKNWPMKLFVTTTPKGKDYIYEHFIAEPNEKPELRDKNNPISRSQISEIDSEENLYLDKAYLMSLDIDYSGPFKLQEKGGKFVQMEGAVWTPYISAPSFVMDNGKYIFPFGIDLSFDFGFRRPAVLFFARLYDERQKKVIDFVFDFMAPNDMLMKSLLDEVEYRLSKFWNYDLPPINITCDAAGDSQNTHTYDTDIESIRNRWPKSNIMYSHQIHFRNIEMGIRVIHNLFSRKELAIADYLGKKRDRNDYVDLVTAISQVAYQELKPNTPMKNNYVKDGTNDHPADALRYWGVFQEPISKRIMRERNEKNIQ
jgi:hypothetical protein